MSVDREQVQALAHAFARRLEHLREFRGVRYVGAAELPAAEPAEPEPAALERPKPEPECGGAGAGAKAGEGPTEAVGSALPEPVPSPAVADRPNQPAMRGRGPARPIQSDDNRPRRESRHSSNHPQSRAPDNRNGRGPAEPASVRAEQAKIVRSEAQRWPAAKKLAYLRERSIGECRRCRLCETRRNIVFGVGDPEADVMFVGEAPGADEDRLGEPFVGAAGRRLDQWIERLGLRRADVYIANVLKCRPPGNRDPRPEEIERCSPFLQAQIRAIEPKVLIALGRFAGCLLLERDLRMYQMREQVHRYREPKSGVEIPLVVTYHPSYVIRSEKDPRRARGGQGRPDRGGVIKSEDEKVFGDLARAVSLARERS